MSGLIAMSEEGRRLDGDGNDMYNNFMNKSDLRTFSPFAMEKR